MRFVNEKLILCCFGVLVSCASPKRYTQILSYPSITQRLAKQPPDLKYFLQQGPFSYQLHQDFMIRVNADELLRTDFYVSEQNSRAPLLIFQHGNKANKEVHAFQAKRAATWGFHALVVEQPNEKRWIKNGEVLGELIDLLYQWPEMLNDSFNRDQIIVIGHSFGGSAAVIASGNRPSVAGIILLDPALVSPVVKKYLSEIHVPVVLLGADPKIFRSRKRPLFYQLIESDMVEVSVANATHNDAQYPHLFHWRQFLGLEDAPERDTQEFFTSAILMSAFSIASTGNTQYAWTAFQKYRKRFVALQRK